MTPHRDEPSAIPFETATTFGTRDVPTGGDASEAPTTASGLATRFEVPTADLPVVMPPVQQIGPYRLLERLGRGGMGTVHRAVHIDTGAVVALKTIQAIEQTSLSSLRREIHALARIRHPGIVPIVDEGLDEQGVPWYAMDLVEGMTLRHYANSLNRSAQRDPLQKLGDTTDLETGLDGSLEPPAVPPGSSIGFTLGEGDATAAVAPDLSTGSTLFAPTDFPGSPISTAPLPRPSAAQPEISGPVRRRLLGVIRRLCSALSFLHGEGMVHRDLKPDNVMVRPDGTPVLMDFGLAVQFSGELSRESLASQTLVGGTIAYIAPEQARGEPVDARADLYALGCILYELITGQRPFRGPTQRDILRQHFEVRPIPPSVLAPGTPLELERLVLSLMEKDPRTRPGHADAVAASLARLGAEELPSGPTESPRARAYLYRPGLVGRLESLHQLEQQLDSLDSGVGGLILVGGESGVGKTRLVMELARRAEDRGFNVILGECQPPVGSGEAGSLERPAESAEALLFPLRGLFESLADRCREHGLAETERLLGRRGPVLSLYAPALATLPGQGNYPPVVELSAEAARSRLYTYLFETLAALTTTDLGRAQPLLLVLDDLQWADELTLGFLRHLLQHLDQAAPAADRIPLLLAGTFRSEEVTTSLRPLLDASVAALQAPLQLGRLDQRGVASIVSDMLGLQRPPSVFSRFVAQQSEGNPFFVAEFLRTAVAEGLLARDELARWQVVTGIESRSLQAAENALAAEEDALAARLQSLPLPHSIRELVGRRLDGLDSEAHRLVEAASVLGREVDPALLGRILGQSEPTLQEALQELIRRQVLEETPAHRLRFVHDKLREVAYERLASAARSHLHRTAAEAIEAGAETAQNPSALGHHWEQAAEPQRAAPYYLAAARRSLARHAQDEAEQLYRAYLRQFQTPTPESIRVRSEWATKLLEPRGRLQDALREQTRAIRDADELGDSLSKIQALTGLGEAQRMLCLPQEAGPTFEQALQLAREVGDKRYQARLLDRLSMIRTMEVQREAAESLLEEALVLSREVGDRETEAFALSGFIRIHRWQGRFEEGRQCAEEAIRLARETGNHRLATSTLNQLGLIHTERNDFASALGAYHRSLALNRESGDLWSEAISLQHLAGVHHCMLELEIADAYFEQAIEVQRRVGNRTAEAWSCRNLAELRQSQGHMEEASKLFQRSLVLSREVRDLELEVLTLLAWGRHERRMTHLEAAEAHLESAIALGQERQLMLLVSWCWCEEGHIALARSQSGAKLLQQAHDLATSIESTLGMGSQEMLGGLQRAQQAFDADQPHRLVLGELLDDVPQPILRWLTQSGLR